MADEHDPFAAGEEEEEGLIMAPLLIAKLQVSFVDHERADELGIRNISFRY